MTVEETRRRAETLFKKEQQQREAHQAMSEYQAGLRVMREKTARFVSYGWLVTWPIRGRCALVRRRRAPSRRAQRKRGITRCHPVRGGQSCA